MFFNALGTMRRQKLTTVTYILTAIFALFVPTKLVDLYQMTGAAASCIAIMGLLFIFMAIFFTYVYISNVKKNNIGKLEKGRGV